MLARIGSCKDNNLQMESARGRKTNKELHIRKNIF